MDADEEKYILYQKPEVTEYELEPGGGNIRVTEETKHEAHHVSKADSRSLTLPLSTSPRLSMFLAGELVELIEAFEKHRPMCLRTNTLKGTQKRFGWYFLKQGCAFRFLKQVVKIKTCSKLFLQPGYQCFCQELLISHFHKCKCAGFIRYYQMIFFGTYTSSDVVALLPPSQMLLLMAWGSRLHHQLKANQCHRAGGDQQQGGRPGGD